MLADRERLDTFATHRVDRRPHPRGRHGHGRLQPLPRGARPHLPALGRPRRAAGARHDRPGRGGPHRPRVPRRRDPVPRLVEVRFDHRDPQPPRRRSGPAAAGPSSSRSSPTRAPSWPSWRPTRGFRATFENRAGHRRPLLGPVATSGWCRPRLAGVDWPGILGTAERHGRAPRGRRGPGGRTPACGSARSWRAAVQAGRDKVTLVIDQDIETFGLWLEQLLAESTGKQGTGVIPITGERLGPPEVYGDDRLFVGIGEHHGLVPLADAGHPVVELGVRRPARPRRPGAACGSSPPPCAARCSASTPSTSPTWPRPRRRPPRCCTSAGPPAIETEPARAAARPGRPGRLRRHPGLRRSRVRGGRRHRGRPHGHPRPAPGGHHRRHRAPLPPLHRPAAQGRAADRRVRPGGRRRPRRTWPSRAGPLVLAAQAGAGRRRPAAPCAATACGPPGSRSTTSWR